MDEKDSSKFLLNMLVSLLRDGKPKEENYTSLSFMHGDILPWACWRWYTNPTTTHWFTVQINADGNLVIILETNSIKSHTEKSITIDFFADNNFPQKGEILLLLSTKFPNFIKQWKQWKRTSQLAGWNR